MGDPDRLLNVTSDADDLERELLASVRNVGPPRGAKDEGWAGLAAQLTAAVSVGAVGAAAHSVASAEAATSATTAKAGIGAAVSSGSSSLIPGAIGKAIAVKVIVALALGASSVGAGAWYVQHRAAVSSNIAPAADQTSGAVTAPPPAAPALVEVSPSPEPTVNALPTPAETTANAPRAPSEPASPSPPPKRVDSNARSRDSLEDESALLTEARAELRAGDARASMATLDRLRAQFPKGVLAQEREVLGIEVLAALGDAEGASGKARAFSDAHPNSPHTARLRRFIIEP
jgi:hypothetical protein